jgi:hypothetical protein
MKIPKYMDINEVRLQFSAAIAEILDGCQIVDNFVDKDMFRVYILTVWGNAVLDPERSGIAVEDLSVLHDYLNEELAAVLGKDATLTSCYEYIVSKPGEDSLIRLQIAAEHKAFLHHFAALILSQA